MKGSMVRQFHDEKNRGYTFTFAEEAVILEVTFKQNSKKNELRFTK